MKKKYIFFPGFLFVLLIACTSQSNKNEEQAVKDDTVIMISTNQEIPEKYYSDLFQGFIGYSKDSYHDSLNDAMSQLRTWINVSEVYADTFSNSKISIEQNIYTEVYEKTEKNVQIREYGIFPHFIVFQHKKNNIVGYYSNLFIKKADGEKAKHIVEVNLKLNKGRLDGGYTTIQAWFHNEILILGGDVAGLSPILEKEFRGLKTYLYKDLLYVYPGQRFEKQVLVFLRDTLSFSVEKKTDIIFIRNTSPHIIINYKEIQLDGNQIIIKTNFESLSVFHLIESYLLIATQDHNQARYNLLINCSEHTGTHAMHLKTVISIYDRKNHVYLYNDVIKSGNYLRLAKDEAYKEMKGLIQANIEKIFIENFKN